MKKAVLAIIMISLTFASCKENPRQEPKPAEEQTETKVAETGHELNNDWIHEIALNDGLKWPANIETTTGVVQMLELINKSQASAIEDFKKLGSALNDKKNKVVKECTMKGPSHDNLHVWLHPLIKKIGLLQNVETKTEGAEIASNIKEHLEGYYSYFK